MRSVLALALVGCGADHPAAARPALALVPMSEITRPRIAVLAIEGPDGTADVPTARLRALVGERDDFVVVDFARRLADEMVLHGCVAADAACLAAISVDAHADFVVFGHLDPSGAIDLAVYGVPANRVTEPIVARDGEVTRARVDKLLDGSAALCTSPLVLLGKTLAGSSVAIDGRSHRVDASRVAVDGLPAGRHRIVIAPARGAPLSVEIDLPCDGAQYRVTHAP